MDRPVRPAAAKTPALPAVIREYVVELEMYVAMLEGRMWSVATELFYEADNHGSGDFLALARLLCEGPGLEAVLAAARLRRAPGGVLCPVCKAEATATDAAAGGRLPMLCDNGHAWVVTLSD